MVIIVVTSIVQFKDNISGICRMVSVPIKWLLFSFEFPENANALMKSKQIASV